MTDRIVLSALEPRHRERTLEWTNDPDLASLLNRARVVGAEEHRRWFQALPGRADVKMFAIEVGPARRHIGNVWLADISARHRKAEVRIVIGDRDALNRGAGTEAIRQLTDHAFDALGLQRAYAYVLDSNPRARRAFEKAGFVLEGTLARDRWIGDRFADVFLLARLKSG